MRTPRSVVVIGAGAIGLATAFHVRRAGLDVTVLDAGRVGRGASWGNGGWVSPVLSVPTPGPGVPRMGMLDSVNPRRPVAIRAHRSPSLVPWLLAFVRNCTATSYREGVGKLAALSRGIFAGFDELDELGLEVGLRKDGNLRACFTRGEAERQLAAMALLRQAGFAVPAEVLDGQALRELEPGLSRDVTAGFLLPEERHVDPTLLTGALAAHLRSAGAEIVEDARVRRLARTSGAAPRVESSKGSYRADAVVIAAGLQSAAVARDLGVRLPLRGGKGYSVELVGTTPPRSPIYFSTTKVGVTPTARGLRAVGGLEFGSDDQVSARMVQGMVRTTKEYFDVSADAQLGAVWAGQRPMTPDGLPVIDGLSGVPGTFVTTGHGMLGVGQSMASGRLLAELITTGRKPDVLAPFAVDRF